MHMRSETDSRAYDFVFIARAHALSLAKRIFICICSLLIFDIRHWVTCHQYRSNMTYINITLNSIPSCVK